MRMDGRSVGQTRRTETNANANAESHAGGGKTEGKTVSGNMVHEKGNAESDYHAQHGPGERSSDRVPSAITHHMMTHLQQPAPASSSRAPGFSSRTSTVCSGNCGGTGDGVGSGEGWALV